MLEDLVISKVKLPFRYAVGATASRFLRQLRDQRALWGTRCSGCKKVWVPARSICHECQSDTEEWVRLSGQGTLMLWTGQPEETSPRLPCLIQLEGADSLLLHRLGDHAGKQLCSGMKVEVVWSSTPKGAITDIDYFRLI